MAGFVLLSTAALKAYTYNRPGIQDVGGAPDGENFTYGVGSGTNTSVNVSGWLTAPEDSFAHGWADVEDGIDFDIAVDGVESGARWVVSYDAGLSAAVNTIAHWADENGTTWYAAGADVVLTRVCFEDVSDFMFYGKDASADIEPEVDSDGQYSSFNDYFEVQGAYIGLSLFMEGDGYIWTDRSEKTVVSNGCDLFSAGLAQFYDDQVSTTIPRKSWDLN